MSGMLVLVASCLAMVRNTLLLFTPPKSSKIGVSWEWKTILFRQKESSQDCLENDRSQGPCNLCILCLSHPLLTITSDRKSLFTTNNRRPGIDTSISLAGAYNDRNSSNFAAFVISSNSSLSGNVIDP